MKHATILRITLTAAFLALAGLPVARAAGGVHLSTIAQREITRGNEKGETETRLVEAARVAPGDEVVYSIHWENAGAEPAEAVVITNPVPAHMVCLGVEEAGATVTLSVDGGKRFDRLENLTVPGADGRPRPARLGDCTHIRWNFARPIQPGQKGRVGFRAGLL